MYLKKNRIRILACGTVRSNRLHGCELKSNKAIQKEGRCSLDYKSDLKSGTIVAKWHDNSSLHIASNFRGIEPVGAVE